MRAIVVVFALACSGCAWLSRDLGHTEADYAAARALAQTLSRGGATPVLFYDSGAETCFVASEKTDGLNKICYYDCPSGRAAITVKNYQLCPLSIKR